MRIDYYGSQDNNLFSTVKRSIQHLLWLARLKSWLVMLLWDHAMVIIAGMVTKLLYWLVVLGKSMQ